MAPNSRLKVDSIQGVRVFNAQDQGQGGNLRRRDVTKYGLKVPRSLFEHSARINRPFRSFQLSCPVFAFAQYEPFGHSYTAILDLCISILRYVLS